MAFSFRFAFWGKHYSTWSTKNHFLFCLSGYVPASVCVPICVCCVCVCLRVHVYCFCLATICHDCELHLTYGKSVAWMQLPPWDATHTVQTHTVYTRSRHTHTAHTHRAQDHLLSARCLLGFLSLWRNALSRQLLTVTLSLYMCVCVSACVSWPHSVRHTQPRLPPFAPPALFTLPTGLFAFL